MDIRLLKPLDAENYRNFRLEALQNNPESFGSSYEEEKDKTLPILRRLMMENKQLDKGKTIPV
ncbi:hypothetical protein [Metabacillus litoralis]|jgi:hypothetical protein|uniref:hypothetical protein n=1 Tax=Metabacillus TaxID=2675233 RepID=UPI0039759D73